VPETNNLNLKTPHPDLELTLVDETRKKRINKIYHNLKKLEDLTREEIKRDLARDYEISTSLNSALDPFVNNIQDIMIKSHDDETKDLLLDFIDAAAGSYDAAWTAWDDWMRMQGRNYHTSSPDASNFNYGLRTVLKGVPKTLEFVIDNNLVEDYKTLVKTGIKTASFVKRIGNVNYIWNGAKYLVASENRWRKPVNMVKAIRDRGEDRYADLILDIMYNNVDIEPLHLESGIDDFVKYYIDMAQNGFRKEVDAILDFVHGMEGFGSQMHVVFSTFHRTLKELTTNKNGKTYKKRIRKKKTKILMRYMQEFKPLIQSIETGYRLSNIPAFRKSIDKYNKLGLKSQIEENIIYARALQDGMDIKDPMNQQAKLPGLEFMLDYPTFVEAFGRQGARNFGKYIEKLTKLDIEKQDTYASVGNIPNCLLWNLKGMDEKEKGSLKKLYNDKPRFQLYLKLVELIAEQARNNKHGHDIRDYYRDFELNFVEKTILEIKNPGFFLEHAETLVNAKIVREMDKVEYLLKSPKLRNEAEKRLRHYSVFRDLKSLHKLEDAENWYAALAERVGFDSEKSLEQYVDKVHESKHFSHMVELVNEIFDCKINPFKALDTMDLLKEFWMRDRVVNLNFLIESDEPYEKKFKTLDKIRIDKNERLLTIMPLDSYDVDDWTERATKKAEDYFREEFKVNVQYPTEVILRIAEIVHRTETKDMVRQLLQMEEKNDHNLAMFTPGKIHGQRDVSNLLVQADYVEGVRTLVAGLISSRPKSISAAYKLFDPPILDSARIYVCGSLSPQYFFYQIKDMLKIIDSPSFEYKHKKETAEILMNTIKETFLISKVYNENRNNLLNLVRGVEALKTPAENFDAIVAKMQDFKLIDNFDGVRLMCCAFLSEDKERTEAASIYYNADPYIGLEHIVPSSSGMISGKPLGVEILANCETGRNMDVLLLDSAEGGHLMQRVPEKKYLNLFLEGLIGAAEDSKSDLLFVPEKAVNGTAKKFQSYFKSFICAQSPQSLHLSKKRGGSKIETQNQHRYLEAFKDREQLSETISGYYAPTVLLRNAFDQKFNSQVF